MATHFRITEEFTKVPSNKVENKKNQFICVYLIFVKIFKKLEWKFEMLLICLENEQHFYNTIFMIDV